MTAPADAENDPGSHFAHDAEPTDEATVPASHFEHAKDPAGAYLPGPQSVQMEAALAPTAAESLPATHSVQTVAALASEYFPAPQLSHAVLSLVLSGFALGADRSSSQRVRARPAVETGGGARLRCQARVLAGGSRARKQ